MWCNTGMWHDKGHIHTDIYNHGENACLLVFDSHEKKSNIFRQDYS